MHPLNCFVLFVCIYINLYLIITTIITGNLTFKSLYLSFTFELHLNRMSKSKSKRHVKPSSVVSQSQVDSPSLPSCQHPLDCKKINSQKKN